MLNKKILLIINVNTGFTLFYVLSSVHRHCCWIILNRRISNSNLHTSATQWTVWVEISFNQGTVYNNCQQSVDTWLYSSTQISFFCPEDAKQCKCCKRKEEENTGYWRICDVMKQIHGRLNVAVNSDRTTCWVGCFALCPFCVHECPSAGQRSDRKMDLNISPCTSYVLTFKHHTASSL